MGDETKFMLRIVGINGYKLIELQKEYFCTFGYCTTKSIMVNVSWGIEMEDLERIVDATTKIAELHGAEKE